MDVLPKSQVKYDVCAALSMTAKGQGGRVQVYSPAVVPLLKHGLRIFKWRGDLRIRTCERRSTLRTQVRKFLLQAGPNFRIDVRSEKITSVLHSLAAALLESLAHAGARRKEQPTNPRKEARSHLKACSVSSSFDLY